MTDRPFPLIGAEMLGLVTLGLYDNPLAIYREYIQNSADAIASIRSSEKGRVEIFIDPSRRVVKIRDNGPGLTYGDALRRLLPIGRSKKQLGTDRGFRGIGRLAGLAFAESVTFITRAHQADPITRITWNGTCLPNRLIKERALQDIIHNCVDIQTFKHSDYPDHFFEVEVTTVARYAAGTLLNRQAVKNYVSEVCPVPLSMDFPYRQRVDALFTPSGLPTSLEVTLSGDPEPAERPYGKTINLSASRQDQFAEFQEVYIPRVEGDDNAAVGWIAHSSYLGAILKDSHVRGIRARVGNIQIGNEAVFDSLFTEERFNRWCVGEIHILDPRIIPNARRDYFEPGPHLRNLENHLHALLRNLSHRCRAASTARNKKRRALVSLCHLEDTYDLATSGYLAPEDAAAMLQKALNQVPSVRENIKHAGLGKNVDLRLSRIMSSLAHTDSTEVPSGFADIPSDRIGVYQEIFAAITDVTSSPVDAKELISAILMRNSQTSFQDEGAAQ